MGNTVRRVDKHSPFARHTYVFNDSLTQGLGSHQRASGSTPHGWAIRLAPKDGGRLLLHTCSSTRAGAWSNYLDACADDTWRYADSPRARAYWRRRGARCVRIRVTEADF